MDTQLQPDIARVISGGVQCPSSDSDQESHGSPRRMKSHTLSERERSGVSSNGLEIVAGDAEQVVGFSIGRTQSYLKSPQTPAAEKARYLQSPSIYFTESNAAPVCANDYARNPVADRVPASELPEDPHRATKRHISNANIDVAVERDSTIPVQSRSQERQITISNSIQRTKKRAYSGPAVLAENLRKLLPYITSILSLRSTPLSGNDSGGQNTDVTGTRPVCELQVQNELRPGPVSGHQASPLGKSTFANGETRPSDLELRLDAAKESSSIIESSNSASSNEAHSRCANAENKRMDLDGNASSISSPPSDDRPLTLRRVTSDNSLFLRKSLSGASSFDDTTRFGEISEQVNSRFKATTDTLQDSNFRLPKMPNISFAIIRPGAAERSNSDLARENTQLIFDRMKPASSYVRPSIASKGQSAAVEAMTPHQRAHPVISNALSNMTGDVVVLGGYRGSILRSAKPPHRQLWIPVKVGLNLRKVDLEVGLADEDKEKMHETIIPNGCLSHIGPVDLCRRLLRHLRKCPNARQCSLRVHDYGYDWRLSRDLLSRRLIEFLEKLPCNHPDVPKQRRGAIVIAHNLGGLLTRHAVNQRPELFAGVVTSYALLPEDGRCFIDKNNGERLDVDFFDINTWDEYRLSPCIIPPLPAAPKEHRRSLIGVFSDNISSSLPLVNRRSSWFGSRESSPSRDAGLSRDTNSQSTLRPEGEVKQTLEPTMNSSSGPSSSSASSTHHLASLFTSNNSPISTTCTIPHDTARAYLTRTLLRVRNFKRDLAHRATHEENNAYSPASVIYGKSVPTVYGARVNGREAIKMADAYDDLAFAAGDGVVLASAAQLPSDYRCVRGGRVETDRGHVGLLGDLEAVGQCLAAVWEARRLGVGLGRDFHRHKRGPSDMT